MVKIVVIGWYGTETIGDRAILAGLLSVFADAYKNFEIKLGSIYPFFTERTISEDISFYSKCAKNEMLDVQLFNSQNIKELDAAIKECDVMVVGGGPLMGFPALFMLEYAFAKAHKLCKRTMILGCGVGPMRKKIYERSLTNIVTKSHVSIFRDATSLQESCRITHNQEGCSIIDPSAFAVEIFRQYNEPKPSEEIVACVREFPCEYKINKAIDENRINRKLYNFIAKIQHDNGNNICLLPMHYFEVGGDDRTFLNKMYFSLNNQKINVQNNPLSLCETMEKISNASACIGMRFHSVVLQTLLNGNNMILDYTDPQTGKIGNFIRQIQATGIYQRTYVNLQTDMKDDIKFPITKLEVNSDFINSLKFRYIEKMQLG